MRKVIREAFDKSLKVDKIHSYKTIIKRKNVLYKHKAKESFTTL